MINFETRLAALKQRRQGSRERAILDSLSPNEARNAIALGRDVRQQEDYERVSESAGIKYAIGSMAAVDDKSTQISIREGNRVADNLIGQLTTSGEFVESRLQGSVALDVHIRGQSDVDMLILVYKPIIVELPKHSPDSYSEASDPRSTKDIVCDVRFKSEIMLKRTYPAATVDSTGNKSIALEGGSLLRKVDIVPAIWYDTREYQADNYQFLRGVYIYHKADNNLILNYPFKHIAYIEVRDKEFDGNLKRVVRLLKNMVADMPDYKKSTAKYLSSYDLAGIGYGMNERLSTPEYFRLGLVEKARAYLQYLTDNEAARSALYVPDRSRIVFDSDSKVRALEILRAEITDLAFSIYRDIEPLGTVYRDTAILQKVVI